MGPGQVHRWISDIYPSAHLVQNSVMPGHATAHVRSLNFSLRMIYVWNLNVVAVQSDTFSILCQEGDWTLSRAASSMTISLWQSVHLSGSPSIPGGVVRLIGVWIPLKWSYLFWNDIPIAQKEIYCCSAGWDTRKQPSEPSVSLFFLRAQRELIN